MAKLNRPGFLEHWRYFKTYGSSIITAGAIAYFTLQYTDKWQAEHQSSFRDKTALYGRPPEKRTNIPWPRHYRDNPPQES